MSVSKPTDVAPTLRPPPVMAPSGMIISANFSVTGFSKRWSHCHQMANFLARYASANEDDPERYATLLSTFFNELLEAIYRNHEPSGNINIKFKRNHGRISVSAEVPANEENIQFYTNAVNLMNQPDPMAWYREQLEHDVPDNDITTLGLLELAVVYGSTLSVTEPKNGTSLTLNIELPFTEVDENECFNLP
ncbi:hypothetical protein WME90_09570 [Sorangium sp. So ce375]|jgi:hypothetical protein|uniref:hypothetical protein n=1 Tax=Sorangium sp. So ce375 TaxID=3133306 RepID=UPI003F5BAED7